MKVEFYQKRYEIQLAFALHRGFILADTRSGQRRIMPTKSWLKALAQLATAIAFGDADPDRFLHWHVTGKSLNWKTVLT